MTLELLLVRAIRTGWTTQPLSPAQGLQGLLVRRCCIGTPGGSYWAGCQTYGGADVHHFISLTLPSENRQWWGWKGAQHRRADAEYSSRKPEKAQWNARFPETCFDTL